MHVRDDRAFMSIAPAYTAIESCEAFATEFLLDEANPAGISGLMHIPGGQTLKNLIGPKAHARLHHALQRYTGQDIDMMPTLSPFVWMNLIDTALFATDHALALDEHLWQYAQSRDKQMYGLETLEMQMELLGQIPLSQQCRALMSLARNIPRHREQLNHLAALYTEGNIQQLYQSSRKSLGPLRQLLLFNRNRHMAQRFDELAQQNTLFAAVGAAHLGGGKGMLRAMKQLGWRIFPVNTSTL